MAIASREQATEVGRRDGAVRPELPSMAEGVDVLQRVSPADISARQLLDRATWTQCPERSGWRDLAAGRPWVGVVRITVGHLAADRRGRRRRSARAAQSPTS